jgi:hypothetical protein
VALARFQRLPRFFMRLLITSATVLYQSTAHRTPIGLLLLIITQPVLLGL